MGQTALSESLRGIEAEIAARQPERALMLSQDVQARYPRALAVQRVIGEVYLALRKTREAIGALDRALVGDPEDARACCARAIVQQIQGDSMGALAWYRRACDMRPSDKVLLSAYRELARSLNQPAYEPSHTGLARLYLHGSLFAHAVREWETILAERPDALEAQVGLAETLWCAGNTPAAAERCRRLLLNSPSCVKALLILAAIEHDAGRDDEAGNLLRRAAELDPDLRIARELFADRLAANDRALSLLVFGEEPPISRVPGKPSVPLVQPVTAGAPAAGTSRSMTGSLTGAPGMPTGARPSVPSQPAARIGTGALAPQMPPIPAPTPGTLPTGGPPAAYSTGAPASRPNGLPPDFHRIFSETGGMLWHDDVEGQETQGRIPNTPTFDRSQAAMPPALAGAGGSLEDTETRLSINFLNWLQAQGAVTQNLAMPGMRGNTSPVPLPPRQHPTGRPLDDPRAPGESEGVTGPLPTGPLPPPTPEALKAMFAELGTEAVSHRVVDADVISARDESDWNTERDEGGERDDLVAAMRAEMPSSVSTSDRGDDVSFSGATSASDASGEQTPVWSDTEAAAAGWIGDGFAQNAPVRPNDDAPAAAATENPPQFAFSGFAPVRDEFAAESATASSSLHTDGDAPPAGAAMTLEALEQGFAQSGFEAYELRPGELAAMATTAPDAQPPDRTSDAGVVMPAQASEPEPTSTSVAPDDYVGRLNLARERRAAGNMDDALSEYRIILKNAPDLFADVMDELNESLADAPDHPEVHRLLGDAHIRQGDYLSALESYNRAVALTQAQGG